MMTMTTAESPVESSVQSTPKRTGRRLSKRIGVGLAGGVGVLLAFGNSAAAATSCDLPADSTYWSGGNHYKVDRQGIKGCIENRSTGIGTCSQPYEITVSAYRYGKGMVPVSNYMTRQSCTYYLGK